MPIVLDSFAKYFRNWIKNEIVHEQKVCPKYGQLKIGEYVEVGRGNLRRKIHFSFCSKVEQNVQEGYILPNF